MYTAPITSVLLRGRYAIKSLPRESGGCVQIIKGKVPGKPIKWVQTIGDGFKSFFAGITDWDGSHFAGFAFSDKAGKNDAGFVKVFRTDRTCDSIVKVQGVKVNLGDLSGERFESQYTGGATPLTIPIALPKVLVEEAVESVINYFNPLRDNLVKCMERQASIPADFIDSILGLPPRF